MSRCNRDCLEWVKTLKPVGSPLNWRYGLCPLHQHRCYRVLKPWTWTLTWTWVEEPAWLWPPSGSRLWQHAVKKRERAALYFHRSTNRTSPVSLDLYLNLQCIRVLVERLQTFMDIGDGGLHRIAFPRRFGWLWSWADHNYNAAKVVL